MTKYKHPTYCAQCKNKFQFHSNTYTLNSLKAEHIVPPIKVKKSDTLCTVCYFELKMLTLYNNTPIEAMIKKIKNVSNSGKWGKAIALCNEILYHNKLDNDSIAKILLEKSYNLEYQRDNVQSLNCVEKILVIAHNTRTKYDALKQKIVLLVDMKKYTEAIATCDHIICTSGYSEMQKVQTLKQKGNILICINKMTDALSCFNQVIDYAYIDGTAVEYCWVWYSTMFEKAGILSILGDTIKAEGLLRKCITPGNLVDKMRLVRETRFENLRKSPEYQKIIDWYNANAGTNWKVK
ncbi:MAG: hypothetical protein ACKVN8_06280 [Nitrosarchaeum sp.]